VENDREFVKYIVRVERPISCSAQGCGIVHLEDLLFHPLHIVITKKHRETKIEVSHARVPSKSLLVTTFQTLTGLSATGGLDDTPGNSHYTYYALMSEREKERNVSPSHLHPLASRCRRTHAGSRRTLAFCTSIEPANHAAVEEMDTQQL
jgi:hypothetical protein